ncbi:hypothetical protein BDZ89DRAFT_153475 [Hymenopellis radicata]|nr:hypothetical protein BDZ89DRAFT_153475 [Hymenopellis radicata]
MIICYSQKCPALTPSFIVPSFKIIGYVLGHPPFLHDYLHDHERGFMTGLQTLEMLKYTLQSHTKPRTGLLRLAFLGNYLLSFCGIRPWYTLYKSCPTERSQDTIMQYPTRGPPLDGTLALHALPEFHAKNSGGIRTLHWSHLILGSSAALECSLAQTESRCPADTF